MCVFQVHRRLLHDDAFGVSEALNETAFGEGLVVTGKHYLLPASVDDSAALYRPLAQQIYHQPQIMFNSTKLTMEQWKTTYTNTVSIVPLL